MDGAFETGMQPANIVNCKCFYGGKWDPDEKELIYIGGSFVEYTLDVCELTLEKVNNMAQKLYNHGDVECFYRIKGEGIQILFDTETVEELQVEGVTHGAIELYLLGSDMFHVNVTASFSDEVDLARISNHDVEIVDLSAYKVIDDGMNDELIEETYVSEIEEVIEDVEAGSSDEEFINAQNMKKEWVSKRKASGKRQLMREKEEKNKVSESTKDSESGGNHATKGVKDDYWGEDESELKVVDEGNFIERDSDDEGPLSLSDDDEESPEILAEKEWHMYDPNTPFGLVQLELGQLFEKADDLRKALIYYSCQTQHSWKYCHNESNRILVKCKSYPSCSWKLSARFRKEVQCLQIIYLKDVHTCMPTMINKRVSATFLAEEYQEKLLKHPTWKLKLFIRDVQDTYGVKITRWQASRAKKNALSACAKVVGKQYESLRDYMYELKRSNVGTSVFLELKPHISKPIPQFHMIYINFPALRNGFLDGCRRVLGLDGAFLKGYCKGEIISVISRDANNQMFPVAWAIVESESKESWSWFLDKVISDLAIGRGQGWTLYSDQQKGLLPAIAEMLPDAEHRLCARHIFTNWIKIIKGAPLHKLFWRAVKAYTVEEFKDVMNDLKNKSQKAYTEMCARDVRKFCRCFYSSQAGTSVTCNNMAETFNSWIIEAREKPILTMLEEIRRQVMSRMVEKKFQASKCNGTLTPRIRAILNGKKEATENWRAIEANVNVYEVQHIHNSKLTYVVRLEQMMCTCKYWDVNGIPCEHALTAICAKNERPDFYVSSWYKKETYEKSYSYSLEPLNGQVLWMKLGGGPILPSDPRVKYGRPSNKRKKGYGELKRKTRQYRVPKGGKQMCSNCKELGHKYRTCPYRVLSNP